MVNDLDYQNITFAVSKKDDSKIEKKNDICINIFCYENYLVYLVHVSDKIFEDCIDLLLITDQNKLHYTYIKDFNRCIYNKAKNKNRKHFFRYCLQFLSSEKVKIEHKNIWFRINGKQSVKLTSCSIKFKNHLKQLAVPFRIYADFQYVLKRVQ